MRKMNKNNKGFTLVELIIVIAIIAILLALITPNLTQFLKTAEDTSLTANAKTAYSSALHGQPARRQMGLPFRQVPLLLLKSLRAVLCR